MKEEIKTSVRLVSAAEMALILGISTRTLRRLRQRGVLKPVFVTPTCVRYDIEEVMNLVRKQGDVS